MGYPYLSELPAQQLPRTRGVVTQPNAISSSACWSADHATHKHLPNALMGGWAAPDAAWEPLHLGHWTCYCSGSAPLDAPPPALPKDANDPSVVA